MKKFAALFMMMVTVLAAVMSVGVSASEEMESMQPSEAVTTVEENGSNENNVLSMKAIAAAVVVAVVGAAGAIGMAVAISKSVESMARQPEIAGKINSAMMLGIVFIETAIIYALIVAILIIFVL